MRQTPEKIDPNGRFGFWFDDEYGLPAYEYTCDQDNDPQATAFNTQGGSNLHWHQIGNDRISAIATNCGWIQAFESSRGMQWLNYRDPRRLCPGAGIALARSMTSEARMAAARPNTTRSISELEPRRFAP